MPDSKTKHYWCSPDEVELAEGRPDNDLAAWREPTPDYVRRRSFLKAVGFGVAGLAVSGCQQAPEIKAIPLPNQPPGITPGRPMHFATVCGACTAGCGVLATCRDGRPIKLEGMPEHPTSAGGLCAMGQASLLGLYDQLRFTSPRQNGNAASWADVDQAIAARLKTINDAGKTVCLLTGTVNGPTLQQVVERFLVNYQDSRLVIFDALSNSAIADSHQQTHGVRAVPQFHFDKSEVIVSFGADFLGTWISPVQFTAQRTAGRQLEGDEPFMSFHAQFESCMSLTGSNADFRMALAPGEFGLALTHLAVKVAELIGQSVDVGPLDDSSVSPQVIADLASRLVQARGKSLVVSGEQDLKVQKLCNFINQSLGNYGSTLDVSPPPSGIRLGSDGDLATLVADMKNGTIGALLVHGTNPVFELPDSLGFTEALNNVDLVVQFATRPDDTTPHADYVCPIPHFLESWSDYQIRPGLYSIGQPVIQPLFDTRPLMETLHGWTTEHESSRDLIERYWESRIYPQADSTDSFRQFFHQAIHDGFVDIESDLGVATASFSLDAIEPVTSVNTGDGWSLVAYPKVGLREGTHAYNPWLQELPDPVSKVTWDNYACLSVAAAQELGVAEGDIIRLSFDDSAGELELPVYVQPGVHDRVVAVALGYGGVATERFAGIGPNWIEARPTVGADGRVGKNIAPWMDHDGNVLRNWRSGLKVQPTGEKYELASTQTYHRITVPQHLAPPGAERRPIVQEASFAEFLQDPHAGHIEHHEFGPEKLYPPDHPKDGRQWAMAVDLTKCTGCSACVVACQAENNISVVGKDEVRRRRDMHWMRIDRYYSGEGDDVDVVHQPMMCQHCDNASCENVCPVLATVQTSEGLNAQVYNRCVGTRYCANNCAYKVRRFNWFYYDRPDGLENMVLNPDVTVRSRGIMEKCSFCVQRIQNAKIEAKRQGIHVTDQSVQTACQQSCPAGAIVFGDINNPESRVSRLLHENPRAFRVLEELDVVPSVHYLTQVRNSVDDTGGEGDEHHG